MAFGFHLRRHLKAGWAFAEGLLAKGKVKKQVPTYITGKQGTVEFNPLKDAFALRLGAKFVRPNRYLMPSGVLVDANGSAQDSTECPGCGSTKTFDNRFFVATRSANPFAKPWEHAWTYCKVCVTPEEIERLKRLAEGSAPAPKRYGR